MKGALKYPLLGFLFFIIILYLMIYKKHCKIRKQYLKRIKIWKTQINLFFTYRILLNGFYLDEEIKARKSVSIEKFRGKSKL